MKVDTTQIKPRSVFETDEAFQKYWEKKWEHLALNEDYYHSVSMTTGDVRRLGRVTKKVEKISKSDQKPKEN